jgi:hypothetical protein
LAGFVMFPLGVFFMLMAYKSSNNMSVILSTSLVAVTIKLSNIFFPGTSPIDVFKPAFAILCESLVVFVMIFFIKIILANTRIHRIDVEFGIHTFPSDRMKYKKE